MLKTWIKMYYELKLFVECFIFYMLNRKTFKRQKVSFANFKYHMEYFIMVDPMIPHIKSLLARMETLDKENLQTQEERKIRKVIQKELSK